MGRDCSNPAWSGRVGCGEGPLGLTGVWTQPLNALPEEVVWAVIQMG